MALAESSTSTSDINAQFRRHRIRVMLAKLCVDSGTLVIEMVVNAITSIIKAIIDAIAAAVQVIVDPVSPVVEAVFNAVTAIVETICNAIGFVSHNVTGQKRQSSDKQAGLYCIPYVPCIHVSTP